MGVIYAIWIDGRPGRYIGSTMYWGTRWSQHRWLLSAGRHHSIHLQRAFVKYGRDRLRAAIIETVSDALLVEREQFWMDHHRGALYNMAPLAGSNVGLRKTAEQKEKSARFHRGRKRSDETRALQSAAMLRRQAAGWRPVQSSIDHARDAAIAAAYFSASSYDAVGPSFGIKGAAAFHAVSRFRSRLSAVIEPIWPGVVLPRRIHPDWADLAI